MARCIILRVYVYGPCLTSLQAEGKIAPSFDIDGDGIVTKDELRQGLDQMKLTEQQKLMIMEQYVSSLSLSHTHHFLTFLTGSILIRMV